MLGKPAGMNVPGGDDILFGGDGDDQIGRRGRQRPIRAGAGNDFATGQMRADTVFGDAGDDELFGGPADDIVKGGDGNDMLIGNFGSDTLLGGKGDDMFLGDNPNGAPDAGTVRRLQRPAGHRPRRLDSCEQETRWRATSRCLRNSRRPTGRRANDVTGEWARRRARLKR